MNNIKNFNLIEDKYLDQEQAHAYVLEHDKTKAKVFIMANSDDNRLFSIGFRTPPKNSTGVCHILEHCVLNGSKKYRTKEPFMDMIKSSLQTFLNAMTYSDKTIYPVASRNLKDFENLMDLYLDAVFNPKVIEEERIFRQEGWRYDLDESGKITYKGVVYNEMKGAMSSAEDQVYQQIYQHLFPDTIYTHNSGGDPYEIPNLTYEDFTNFYKDHYHPSNSYIFLYGDLDFEKYLTYIDEEYLSNYEYKEIDSSLPLQDSFTEKKTIVEYFSTDKEIKDNSNMISYSIITAPTDNNYDIVMNQLIKQVLINSESSPLKEAINQLDIVEDIISASSNMRQIAFSILAKNIKESDADLFVETLEQTLEKLVNDGIDQDLIKSMLNVLFFSLKEKNDNATKGIEYLVRAFDTWLYDLSPIDALDLEETLEYIKNNISEGIFEKYIKEHMLDNPHKLVILHKPKLGMNEERDKEVEKKLADLYDSLSDEQKEEMIQQTKDMADFQNRIDTPEDKATIPTLELNDVNSKFEPVDRTVIEKDGCTILTHELPTSGIDYLNLVFNVDHIDPSETIYLSVLADILGLLDTQNYNYKDLFTKIYLESGGISFNLGNTMIKETKEMKRTLTVSTKAFSDNINKALGVLEEILFASKFDNLKRFKELINMIKSRLEMNLLYSAHALMMSRANSSKYIADNFMEKVSGIDYFLFYKNLKEEDMVGLLEKISQIYADTFKRNKLVVNITSDFTRKDELFDAVYGLVDKLDDEVYEVVPYEFTPSQEREAFITSTDVSYVSYSADLEALGYKYDGSATVFSNLLSNAYLYSEIRAKAGAYGAGMVINNKNLFATYSYRDPNVAKTIETYNNLPSVMREFPLTKEDLKSYIIGAVGRFDPPLTEKGKGRRDLEMYLSGLDYKEIESYVETALSSNPEGLKDLAPLMEHAIESASLAVLTNQKKYEEDKKYFDKVIELI